MEYISPNMATGYARDASQSLYPNLWNDLVGYWSPAMGIQGNNLIDWTGTFSNSTWQSTPTWVPGRNGYSFQTVTGFSYNIKTGTFPPSLVSSNQRFTISVWVSTTTNQASTAGIWTVQGGRIPTLRCYGTNNKTITIIDSGGTEASFTSPIALNDGNFHNFVVTYNASAFTIYIDGRLLGTSSITPTENFTSSTYLALSGGGTNNTIGYVGNYGDIGIWSRVLTQSEIMDLAEGQSPLQFVNPEEWLLSPNIISNNQTVNLSVLSLTSTLYSPILSISSTTSPSVLSLTSILHTPLVGSFKTVSPSLLSLTSTLYSPILIIDSTIKPSLLTLTTTLHAPNIFAPGTNELSFASAIISYNPLIIVSNTNPVKVSIVNVSSPDTPIYTSYSYSGCSNATAVNYNADLNMIYVSCADGIILEIDASSPTSFTINYTGASGNLTSLDILPNFFDVYAGTDYSTGEAVNMYEGSATTVACDIRFSASYQSILGTQINTINAQTVSTDIRFSGIVNNIFGCDIRFISTSYVDLSITPIARTDFIVYIGGIECPDVKLDSIEITHTADDKSQATFTLSRKHDNVNYVLNPDNTQGTYIPVLGHPTVQITIQGNPEFGYDTPAYIWDVDCKSENEQVKIVAYSELPKQDERSNVTLSIPLVNEKLHVYHALVNNPVIDNPVILADDINPPFYLGILIDNGYTRIQNITQYQGFSSISQTEDQFVNYVFGSGDSGITDINGNDIYFKPLQNWTYFWFGHATNFITGQTWEGLLSNGSSYLGTSPSSLTTTTWDVDYINFWYQREFPNSVYRGAPNGTGSAIVYPSDFLGIVEFPYNPDPLDGIVGFDPFNGATTIDQVLRDHTPTTFSGDDILNTKTRLAVFTSPGSTLTTINGINYLITLEGTLTPVQLNMSTKILDVIDGKFGLTWGTAPFKKVSAKSGILTTVTKWEDVPNGLFYHKQQGYNYVNYTNSVGEIEFEKIQNINGSVLPKTKCDIEQFLDGYYYYNIQLLKRINIDQTTQTNIYDGNNGFPVSVKSIHISSKDMKVTLDCTNAWSRLELLELEGQIPNPYSSLIPEVLTEYTPKFDPNSLTNTT